MNDDLQTIRKLIDIVDDRLLDLLMTRRELALRAMEARHSTASDNNRENDILNRISARRELSELDQVTFNNIYRILFSWSKQSALALESAVPPIGGRC